MFPQISNHTHNMMIMMMMMMMVVAVMIMMMMMLMMLLVMTTMMMLMIGSDWTLRIVACENNALEKHRHFSDRIVKADGHARLFAIEELLDHALHLQTRCGSADQLHLMHVALADAAWNP